MKPSLTFLFAILLAAIEFGSIAQSAEVSATIGIVAKQPEKGPFVKLADDKFMVPYTMKIPGTEVSFEMVPIPGGKFLMGSPAGDKAASPKDQQPQREIIVEPFWMAKYEVTWAEYQQYMGIYAPFKKFEGQRIRIPFAKDGKTLLPDAVTAPTTLWEPPAHYENGEDPRLPAVTMTQFGARQYTKWLSAITGHYYRLPSEAEWEYAARAGTKSIWFFGDDATKLGNYAWTAENAKETTHPVGQKQSNPWGLFDIYGNVAEWTLDQYSPAGYPASKTPLLANDAIVWPTKLYPRVLRGGSYYSKPTEVNSAARLPSNDDEWKTTDPQLPTSPWWFSDEPFLGIGFRIVRFPGHPTPEQRKRAYDIDCQAIQDAVDHKLYVEPRGVVGIADLSLPEAIEKLEAKTIEDAKK